VKDAEEGRPWDLILPEIVYADTNDDDMPGRGRRTQSIFLEPRNFTEVIATTVLRSITPKKQALMEELVSRSHKQVKMRNDHGLG
jgi:hypothetical protein